MRRLILLALATACSSEGSGTTNIHTIENRRPAGDPGYCYPAYDDLSCSADRDFNWPDLSEVGPLPSVAEDVEDGRYAFCPDVENCDVLTGDEVAALACQFRDENGLPGNLAYRPVCGPEATAYGHCCYLFDVNLLMYG